MNEGGWTRVTKKSPKGTQTRSMRKRVTVNEKLKRVEENILTRGQKAQIE